MKIDKHVKKRIRKAVKDLPKLQHKTEKVYRMYYGSALITLGITKLDNGETVQPNNRYVCLEPKEINHVNEAEISYKRNGMAGVCAYIETVFDIAGKTPDINYEK